MFLKKMVPPLYQSLGIFLPLITTNCAVLGIAILVQREQYSFGTSVYYAFVAGLGFMLALVVLAAHRERFEIARLPESLKGPSIGLVMAGMMSLTFFAFKGMI
jgi:electron transport complex protein RnfA